MKKKLSGFFINCRKRFKNEQGAALAIAIILVAILSVISLTTLAFSSSEVHIAGSELRRAETFYAATSGMEKMTDDFSNLFRKKVNPTTADLDTIAKTPPTELENKGFTFLQTIDEDTNRLNKLRQIQNLPGNLYPRVNIPEGPYAGLYATVVPYRMTSTATQQWSNAQVKVEKDFNNYLVPLFQFAVFSNDDLEFLSGTQMNLNGRVHTNKNLYLNQNVKFLGRVTAAGEAVRDVFRSGKVGDAGNVYIEVSGKNVPITKGSVEKDASNPGGPFIVGSLAGERGYAPGSPQGVINPNWNTTSMLPANGAANRFGGQLITQSTGASELKMPLQVEGNAVGEIIKRSLPTDSQTLKDSRYSQKAVIRVSIDDEDAGNGAANAAGLTGGVLLRNFMPTALDGGSALKRVSDAGDYLDYNSIKQINDLGQEINATTVRGLQSFPKQIGADFIPSGAGFENPGLSGRIKIEIIKPDETAVDVTEQILSMGMTEGEPNGIFYLQRPLWMAYVQGSRDRDKKGIDIINLTNDAARRFADGEIIDSPEMHSSLKYLTESVSSLDEDAANFAVVRQATPTANINTIVPINVYNVREGWYNNSLNPKAVYERGITNVVEVNMKNLARWLDGIYDNNLLKGTPAVSSNIKGEEGYVVYISDRRGDKVKDQKTIDGATYRSTNGMVDNEDIYGPNNQLDDGEDVIDFGWDGKSGSFNQNTLEKDTSELPDTGTIWCVGLMIPCNYSYLNASQRGEEIMKWKNPTNYFRRAVRLMNADTLSFSGANGKLSPTKGITVSTENMVYIWGNYNTTGVSSIPAGGAAVNDGTGYMGAQIPSSIVCDAFFPLSKTWFDASSAIFPEGAQDPGDWSKPIYREADANLDKISDGTAVRAALLFGNGLSRLSQSPGRNDKGERRSGESANYPRFIEFWGKKGGNVPYWSYTGSFCPLFTSTQAIAPWNNDNIIIYAAPQRNWSFDTTYTNPTKLPPGTPFFQYVSATGFRQNYRQD